MQRLVLGLLIIACASLPASLSRAAEAASPQTVRHDVAQAGDPIVTLRYFRIRKGSFATFLQASTEGVWPYFEKIGARPLGMWQVIHPADAADDAGDARADYDEVWLATGYASLAHWRATRDMVAMGGNGPDYAKAVEALRVRRELTLYTDVRFMEGTTWTHPPLFMPPVR